MVKIGIIGGSGLDNSQILEEPREMQINTPYGKPSSSLLFGKISGTDVLILSRHGKSHSITPTKVNNKANIFALKEAGCTHIIATTACGSLKKEIERGDIVILDQFIDFTRHRDITFYEDFSLGIKHTAMAEPFDKNLRSILIETSKKLKLKTHEKGTVITIEGPRFSTKAESRMFRNFGADVINMSIAPEITLANEAGIPYAAIALSTDYDCLFDDIPHVTWEEILKVFEENVEKVKTLILESIPQISNKESIKSYIRTIPDWPKKGIMFRDITTLLKDKHGFNLMLDQLTAQYAGKNIDVVAGIESRGFIIGSALANRLGIGFIPIRKAGKLPAEKVSMEYSLEYGKDKIEIHKDAITKAQKVLLVDDLIATAGTSLAAANLIKSLGGDVVECSFVIELTSLKGRQKLESQGFSVFSLVQFEGE